MIPSNVSGWDNIPPFWNKCDSSVRPVDFDVGLDALSPKILERLDLRLVHRVRRVRTLGGLRGADSGVYVRDLHG